MEKQRVNPTQNPNRDDQPRSPELSCNFARSAQDARADCASNAHSNPKTNANDAEKMSFGADGFENGCSRGVCRVGSVL